MIYVMIYVMSFVYFRCVVKVAWTGKLAAAMPLKGVEITWAHASEEIRVLTSPDGSNFEEAICFRPTGKVSRF